MGKEIFRGFDKMKEINKCRICGKNEFKYLFKKQNSSKKKINFFKCKNCEIIFPNPSPTNKELKKHYSKEKYYALKKIDKNSRKVKFRHLMYKTYFKKNKDFVKKILFIPFKFLIRGTKIIPKNKLLDIGSGNGQFIYEMKMFGVDVYGVEPNNFNEIGSKEEKLKIKKSDLISAKYPKEYFNLITMNHVLEHLNNPSETIKEIHRILKKEGLFIMGLPNSNSLAYNLFKKNWLGLSDEGHLINYSEKNLSKFLEDYGFKIKKVRYNSRPNQFVVGFYLTFNIKKRRGAINRILEAMFVPLTLLVNSLKIGDQIEIWCTK